MSRFNVLYRIALTAVMWLLGCCCNAQWMMKKSDQIHSMEVMVNNAKVLIPCIELKSRDVLTFSFDDVTKEYHRYLYSVEHCDYQWRKSTRIFESDYLRGSIRRIPVDDYSESINTTQDYTHYAFVFPNNQLNIVYSGNYRIRVFDDETKEEVCSYCFCVVESKTPINVTATTNTEIDWNKTHQQLKISVIAQPLNVYDIKRELKMVVVQNGRWDNAVWNPEPDYYTPREVKWENCRQLIFDGGNEFRKFEMTSVKTAMMAVDNLKWFRPFYHATLFPAEDRLNYIYDEDQNGNFYVRTTEHNSDETEADYVWVHFSLKHKPEPGGNIYIYGGLTNWCILPEAQMKYNPEQQMYEGTMLLKEGYYNYQYMYIPSGSTEGSLSQIEGSFYQTENEYTVLVYYTQKGSRYDRLVGYRNLKFEPSKQ